MQQAGWKTPLDAVTSYGFGTGNYATKVGETYLATCPKLGTHVRLEWTSCSPSASSVPRTVQRGKRLVNQLMYWIISSCMKGGSPWDHPLAGLVDRPLNNNQHLESRLSTCPLRSRLNNLIITEMLWELNWTCVVNIGGYTEWWFFPTPSLYGNAAASA